MRLWSLHPKYLDRAGLTALWREGLLAKKVLEGQTRGYRNHPQLERFRACKDPLGAINAYLEAVRAEAQSRGYNFDPSKISAPCGVSGYSIKVSGGQMVYEKEHLLSKLSRRDAPRGMVLAGAVPEPHPLFLVDEGDDRIEEWERA